METYPNCYKCKKKECGTIRSKTLKRKLESGKEYFALICMDCANAEDRKFIKECERLSFCNNCKQNKAGGNFVKQEGKRVMWMCGECQKR